MIVPYPLRLLPFYRDYLWGGRKLQTVLGKNLPGNGVWAESWEIVDHPEHSSAIVNGPLAGTTLRQLANVHPEWLQGDLAKRQPVHGPHSVSSSLPLLLKYLDCQRVLSVQVHPDDEYGLQMNPPDLGKTEAWYIISAEPGSVLYAGLKPGVTRDDLRAALTTGSVEQCLHRIHPNAGDCVFIPAGTVHALGAGLLVAEIQQASNTTFRLFDWNRLDADGKPRALHIDPSLEVIDFESGPRTVQTPRPVRQTPDEEPSQDQAGLERLVECDKFLLDRLLPPPDTKKIGTLGGDGRCHLVTVPTGTATIRWSAIGSAQAHGNLDKDASTERLSTGQSLLLPATLPAVTVELEPNSTLLDMREP